VHLATVVTHTLYATIAADPLGHEIRRLRAQALLGWEREKRCLVAYVPGDAPDWGGGYTAAVLCGLSVDCTDHGLLPVTVIAGQVTSGIDPTDWYAEPGAFPPNPVP
jgi:hypothetical protein